MNVKFVAGKKKNKEKVKIYIFVMMSKFGISNLQKLKHVFSQRSQDGDVKICLLKIQKNELFESMFHVCTFLKVTNSVSKI